MILDCLSLSVCVFDSELVIGPTWRLSDRIIIKKHSLKYRGARGDDLHQGIGVGIAEYLTIWYN